jgi:hypothetical protein
MPFIDIADWALANGSSKLPPRSGTEDHTEKMSTRISKIEANEWPGRHILIL